MRAAGGEEGVEQVAKIYTGATFTSIDDDPAREPSVGLVGAEIAIVQSVMGKEYRPLVSVRQQLAGETIDTRPQSAATTGWRTRCSWDAGTSADSRSGWGARTNGGLLRTSEPVNCQRKRPDRGHGGWTGGSKVCDTNQGLRVSPSSCLGPLRHRRAQHLERLRLHPRIHNPPPNSDRCCRRSASSLGRHVLPAWSTKNAPSSRRPWYNLCEAVQRIGAVSNRLRATGMRDYPDLANRVASALATSWAAGTQAARKLGLQRVCSCPKHRPDGFDRERPAGFLALLEPSDALLPGIFGHAGVRA